jgi:HSP20 family protein
MAIRDIISIRNKRELPVRRMSNENPFQLMQREINRLFDNFFDDFQLTSSGRGFESSFPRIDIKDDDKEIVVEAEVPGMDDKDIDISLSNNVLTISGEKRQEKEEKKDQYYYAERSYGAFHRDIPLHCEIEEKKVQATYKKGVLTITLPKTPEAQRKTKNIPIQIT